MSTTATVATTTALFTKSTTTTATATNIILQTTTVSVTSTDVQTAPAITTTTFVYTPPGPNLMPRDNEVVARGNNPWGIPDYAWPACQDWDHYVDACKCFGIHPITITKKPTTTTVTVTASNAIITTVSTLTTTTTNTIPVTATTSATFTAVIEVITGVTTTQTMTEPFTVIVSTTTTPTVTLTQTCKPPGVPFRIADSAAGVRNMAVVAGGVVTFSEFGPDPGPFGLRITTFVLDSNGFLELAAPANPGDPDVALYINLIDGGETALTEQLFANDQPVVEAGAPGLVRVQGCINSDTNVVYLWADGRTNTLLCFGGNALLSASDGLELSPDCMTLTPVAQ